VQKTLRFAADAARIGAVMAVNPAVAVAGLAATSSLKPQNRPDFRFHSNHVNGGTPPPSASVLHPRSDHRRARQRGDKGEQEIAAKRLALRGK
jgi:hypothetical protein